MPAAVLPRPRIELPPTAPIDGKPFLTATWRDFLMLSYEIEPRVLEPFIPAGTELDYWRERCFISLVGFRFCEAALFGVRVPWHQHFAEVNLRFYVRRRLAGAWRRGVVFLRELAGKRAVALVARVCYGERFRHVPLACRIDREAASEPPLSVEFTWRDHGSNFRLAARVHVPAGPPEPETLDEFVVEHYYAYTAGRRRESTEYQVAHVPWTTAQAEAEFLGDAYRQYGPRFAPYLRGEPTSAFWASGSPVRVYPGNRLGAVVLGP